MDMGLSFEEMDLSRHDPGTVAGLMYDTDPGLFRLMFGRRHTSISKIRSLIVAGGNSFGYEDIYVACLEREVVGIAIAHDEAGLRSAEKSDLRMFLHAMGVVGTLKLVLFAGPVISRILTDHVEPCELYLSNVSVAPEMRGKGVGTFLVENMACVAREKGYKMLVLDASIENEDAKRLYDRLGFEVSGQKSIRLPWKSYGTYTMRRVL
jgi:ribosomal protein S18 acetylase RimI-like enzyme